MFLRFLVAALSLGLLCGCDTLGLSKQSRAQERDLAVQYDQAWAAAEKVLKRYFPMVRAEQRTGQIVALTLPSSDIGRKTRQRIVAELIDNRDGWYEVEVRVMNQLETSHANPVTKSQSGYEWKTISFDEALEGKLVNEIYREIRGEEVAGDGADAPSRDPGEAPIPRKTSAKMSEPRAVTSRSGATSHLAFVTRKASIKDPFVRAIVLGDMHFKEGNYEGADEQYVLAQKRAPSNPVGWLAAGHARFAMGEYAKAAKAVRSGLAAFGKISSVNMDRRDFYGDPDQFYDQLAKLEEFARQNPEHGEAFFLLGYNYYFSGRATLARKAFERALELQPKDPQSGQFLRLLDSDPVI